MPIDIPNDNIGTALPFIKHLVLLNVYPFKNTIIKYMLAVNVINIAFNI